MPHPTPTSYQHLKSYFLTLKNKLVFALLGFIAVWCTLLLVLYTLQKQSILDGLAAQGNVEMNSFVSVLRLGVYRSIREANTIAEEIQSCRDDASGDWEISAVEQLLKRHGEENSDYYMLRLLDSAGKELARVELSEDGGYQVIPSEQLEDKSHRYYYQIASSLKPGNLYLSDIDFHIGQEDTQFATRPTVRIAIPLGDQDSLKGLLVLNTDIAQTVSVIGRSGLEILTGKGLRIFLDDKDRSEQLAQTGSEAFSEQYLERWADIRDGVKLIPDLDGGDGFMVPREFSIRPEDLFSSVDKIGNIRSDLSFYLLNRIDEAVVHRSLGSLALRLIGLWVAISVLALMIYVWIMLIRKQERKVNEQLQNQSEFLNTLLAEVPIPIFYRNTEGSVWRTNPAFRANFCGRETSDLESCDLCAENRPGFCRVVFDRSSAFLEDESRHLEQEFVFDDGEKHHEFTLHCAKYFDNHGRVSGMIGGLVDISRFKEQTKQLEEARQEAVKANKAKGAFLATMSHEIRTPLNGIIGMTGLMADTNLSENQTDYIDTIKASGETLLNLINDILDFSKIEADRIDLEVIPFNIETVICEVLDLLSRQTNFEEMELVYRIAPNVKTDVQGDMMRVKQVLLNLVGNAVKFSHKGSVIVEVENIPENEEIIRISVIDTGIGIHPNRLDSLFEPFVQEDSSTTRRFGGTGLGLTICKRLVNAMGGEITVTSEVDKGSVFSFTLPVGKKISLVQPDNSQSRILSHLSALVVDDNPISLRILKEMLEGWHMEVYGFSDPIKAFQWLKSGNHCDVIISDHLVQSVDGETFGKKSWEYLRHANLQTPILLLSAEDDFDPEIFSKHIAKPMRREHILNTLVEVMSRQSKGIPRMVTTRNISRGDFATQYPLKILVAEDNKVNQRVVNLILKKMGYEADFVENGYQAFKEYEKATENKAYDVVLMDIQMPILDGIQAGRKIREMERENECCIIALTANVLEETREDAMASGFNDYLCKPVKVETLRNSLEKAWIYLNRMSPERKENAKKAFFTAS